jgi:hypothetical protein
MNHFFPSSSKGKKSQNQTEKANLATNLLEHILIAAKIGSTELDPLNTRDYIIDLHNNCFPLYATIHVNYVSNISLINIFQYKKQQKVS